MPALVRIPHLSPEYILNALDCGATGILAPHVKSVSDAQDLAKMCRYGKGGRGYAGSSRAARYTTSNMKDNIQHGNEQTAVIAQIEDIDAIDNIDAIAEVDGIDCLFVGRIDLTVAMGAETPEDLAVVQAVEKICAAGKKTGRRIGMFVGDLSEIPKWREAGASLFILKSDHGFLLEAAESLCFQFNQYS